MEEKKQDKNPIQVADRIFQVIEVLAAKGQCGLLDLSRELELNKTTVHRILNSLTCMGYVKQDTDTSKYSLTFKICELSNQILTQIDIVDIARPYLKELMRKTEETIHLVERNGLDAVYIDKVEAFSNAARLVSKVGRSIPLYCSGVGKALLADMSDDEIAAIWNNSSIHALTPHTITDFPTLMERIRKVRVDGFALDDEENELGVRCVAVSLKDYKGSSKYAISLSSLVSRMDQPRMEELAKELMETKQKITAAW